MENIDFMNEDAVFQLWMKQLQVLENLQNGRLLAAYEGAVADVDRNFREKGTSFPIPAQPRKVHYWASKTGEHAETSGPELLGQPYSYPVPQEKLSGVVDFGPPLEGTDFSGFNAGPTNTASAGSKAVKDGKEYVLLVLGQRGTINFRQMWVATGN